MRADDEAARHRPADVVVVHHDRRPGDDLALPEDRHREDAVVGVERPPPGVVGEEHVALVDVIAPASSARIAATNSSIVEP